MYLAVWKMNVGKHPISFQMTKWMMLHATDVYKTDGSFSHKIFSSSYIYDMKSIGTCLMIMWKNRLLCYF